MIKRNIRNRLVALCLTVCMSLCIALPAFADTTGSAVNDATLNIDTSTTDIPMAPVNIVPITPAITIDSGIPATIAPATQADTSSYTTTSNASVVTTDNVSAAAASTAANGATLLYSGTNYNMYKGCPYGTGYTWSSLAPFSNSVTMTNNDVQNAAWTNAFKFIGTCLANSTIWGKAIAAGYWAGVAQQMIDNSTMEYIMTHCPLVSGKRTAYYVVNPSKCNNFGAYRTVVKFTVTYYSNSSLQSKYKVGTSQLMTTETWALPSLTSGN